METRDDSSRFLKAFEIKETLGSGSFGAVFKVSKKCIGDEFDYLRLSSSEDGSPEISFETDFAVKIIPEGKVTEVSPAAQLVHPHIVPVYNIWAEGEGSKVKDLDDIREFLGKQRVYTSSSSFDSDRGQGGEGQSCEGQSGEGQSGKGQSGKGQSGDRCWTIASSFLIPPFLLVQMEFCTEGDLDNYLLNKRPFLSTKDDPDCFQLYYPETQNFFMQILEALSFMELKDIVHGDLKPNNIFLTRKPSSGALILKIGDFGLSSPMMGFAASTELKKPQNPALVRSFKEIREIAKDKFSYFKSPELLEVSTFQEFRKIANGATHKSDMYSLGLIFITMLIPFKSKTDRNDSLYDARDSNFHNKNFTNLEKYRGDNEFSWIKKLISPKISDRPLASELQEWTKNVDGYVIDYGRPTSKSELDLGLVMFENYKDDESPETGQIDDELDIVLRKWFHRHFNTYLKKLLHDALISLPNKSDDLIIQVRDYLDSNPDTISSNMVDLQYFNLKIGSVLAEGLEDLGKLESEFKLALTYMNLKTPQGFAESFVILTRIQSAETFQKLELSHDFKLKIIAYALQLRCIEFDQEDELNAEFNFEFDPEELEVRLEEVEELYRTLTPCGPDCKGPLEHSTMNLLFCVQAKILVKLGRTKSAVKLFDPIMSTIALELAEPEEHELSQFTPKVLLKYCEFLAVCDRVKEALENYRELGRYYLNKSDSEACQTFLDNLLQLYETCGLNVPDVIENNLEELFGPIMILLFRTIVTNKVKNLEIDPNQFSPPNYEDERARVLDFDRLDQLPED